MSKNYKREDFISSSEVRWCPGCGDYAILAALQKLLPELGLDPAQHVFVSGIGCAGRLPYYMNTYGFHTIHGRAPTIASGLKAMREDLTVWVITGDGDALSIGANHLIHCLRRNVNVNILLINNQVYGLTKGQFSPTSKRGQVTKTSPQGANNEPINPLLLALAAGASFVARAVDKDPNHLGAILKQAYLHQGCSFIEIYQDCNIFNHGAFDNFSLKTQRAANTVLLTPGEPLIFNDKKKALSRVEDNLEIVDYNPEHEVNLYRHEAGNFMHALRLAQLSYPKFPVPLGVYYQQVREVFTLTQPITKTEADLENLFREKAMWQQD